MTNFARCYMNCEGKGGVAKSCKIATGARRTSRLWSCRVGRYDQQAQTPAFGQCMRAAHGVATWPCTPPTMTLHLPSCFTDRSTSRQSPAAKGDPSPSSRNHHVAPRLSGRHVALVSRWNHGPRARKPRQCGLRPSPSAHIAAIPRGNRQAAESCARSTPAA
ncbi:hypothetical protein HZS92_02859 [Xanthomonas citri pv. citri]|uniref:Uncharacterized protein n=1 Tax=Xanthomonas axonopodis pv. citri (strain 306) TaxID=190486 RepID=A0AAI7ZGG8_XANAC|nr:hypothetical protein XAC2673 [Xanthomonas citri pv. citri str. 306]QYF36191.1 hypothetical protein HZS91_02916 [Xanthomonas citri pv. citri]QYF40757.1 hypothetical protein HZS92_02859 [Xanthomonas citri pv. citri]QYF45567.1 hypothetical protein HZS93_02890 [Xanthomonas citri]